jgi:hypothetical protein
MAVISAANTARDGTGTIVNVETAGASGTRIDDIVIIATGTTTAGMVRLFLHDGTNARLWREVPVTAITPSATVQAFTATLSSLALVLQTGWSLRASTHNAETFNVLVTRAGDF